MPAQQEEISENLMPNKVLLHKIKWQMNFTNISALKLPIEAEEDEIHLLESYTTQHVRQEASPPCYIKI